MQRLILSGIMLIAVATTGPGQDVTLETAAPVVVKTVPEAGSDSVDATLAEIKVTFSKRMTEKSWSWARISPASFPAMPEGVGPRFENDGKTAVLPVKLEKGRTYAVWVNTSQLGNFKDLSGLPAVPYLLVFKTRP